MSLKLVMYSDFICPFCFIGFETVRRLIPEFGLEIEWKGFQIHPEWPAEGMPASEYRRGMDDDTRRMMWERIAGLGATVGLEMKPPALLANSRLALEAAEFAQKCGKAEAEAFEERVYRAYFNEGRNIGSQSVLGELAAEVGLDRDELTLALESNRYSLRLKNTALAAHQRGVDGVPTFFVGDYPLVGAQSEDVMRQILQRYVQKMAAAK
ncbi:MAG TPA: DsbA family oxidoreductase [Candidatus Binataceae bacterium]|nr:DsbA family oxidoreductase [Candidatus Binataceae bacterium]